MKYLILLLSVFVSSNVYSAQTLCGWLDNPTPANIRFINQDGSWSISTQGGENVDDKSINQIFAAMKNKSNFVRTNRNYGFTCVCLTVDINEKNHSIVKVHKAEQLLLKQCLEDVSTAKHIPL